MLSSTESTLELNFFKFFDFCLFNFTNSVSSFCKSFDLCLDTSFDHSLFAKAFMTHINLDIIDSLFHSFITLIITSNLSISSSSDIISTERD